MNGRVVLIGAGGIGAPAAITLGEAGVRELTIVDDDRVDLTNLHRQILFEESDVGRSKLDALDDALRRRFKGISITKLPTRALPNTVAAIVSGAAVVVDATDNFASRFLLADACRLARVAVVHAAAVELRATVMAAGAEGRPCYRCLFEDLPAEGGPDCASAGVLGPVCGVAGAIAADRVLRILAGDGSALGHVVTFDGRRDALRTVAVRARDACPLCGPRPLIDALDPARYAGAVCNAALS
jgi:molybdopterin/thiamine biosynthesis adenylyltransferase